MSQLSNRHLLYLLLALPVVGALMPYYNSLFESAGELGNHSGPPVPPPAARLHPLEKQLRRYDTYPLWVQGDVVAITHYWERGGSLPSAVGGKR